MLTSRHQLDRITNCNLYQCPFSHTQAEDNMTGVASQVARLVVETAVSSHRHTMTRLGDFYTAA